MCGGGYDASVEGDFVDVALCDGVLHEGVVGGGVVVIVEGVEIPRRQRLFDFLHGSHGLDHPPINPKTDFGLRDWLNVFS